MTTKSSRRRFIESSVKAVGLGMLAPTVLDALNLEAAGPKNSPGPKPLSSHDQKVRELLARMTLEEKVGQMTQAEQNDIKEGTSKSFFWVRY
jgi:beta-glucosidase